MFSERLERYVGKKVRNLLKPPIEERFRVPFESFYINTSVGREKVDLESLLSRVRQFYDAEVREQGEEYFIAVKLRNRQRPYADPNLEFIKIDRIGAIRALVGRPIRGKHILSDVRPGRYNVRVKNLLVGQGILSERPKSSRLALFMQNSPRYLPDLRLSELHEIAALLPIPRGPTLAMLGDDVREKKILFLPAPDDLGLAAMLAKRGAKVTIVTSLKGLINRTKKIAYRIGLKIEYVDMPPKSIRKIGSFDYVIINPISSDIGLRPQPYLEPLSRGKLRRIIDIQKRYFNIALKNLSDHGHLLYVVNTIDVEEIREFLLEALPGTGLKTIYPGVEGIEVEVLDGSVATIVTRDEGSYFTAMRFSF